jgi:hypothetical protein
MRAKEFIVENVLPKVGYHVIPSSKLQLVITNGIKADKFGNTYIWDSYDMAEWFRDFQNDNNEDRTILTIDTTGLQMERDPEAEDMSEWSSRFEPGTFGGAWIVSGSIEPSRITKHTGLTEAPLQSYTTMGDFDKPGPFRGPDKKLVPHPTNILKTQRFLEQTPYDFRLFFSNIPGTGKYSEHGPMDAIQLKQIFGDQADQIINGSDDAITVVFVGNKGDAKVPLTPWIIAHRFGHAIQAGVRKNRQWSAWGEAENHFFSQVNQMLEEYYGKIAQRGYGTSAPMKTDLTPEYNALFNAIGTQRSSRSSEIKRPYEFLYELFAQYLGTGKITLNPLPTNLGYGKKAWGTPSKYLNIKPEFRDESERADATDMLANDMGYMFDDVLSSSVGKIFVM